MRRLASWSAIAVLPALIICGPAALATGASPEAAVGLTAVIAPATLVKTTFLKVEGMH